MRSWNSLFELLRFPLEIVFLGVVFLGIGNIITNPALGFEAMIQSDVISAIGEISTRIGQFVVVNFPLIFLIRLTTRKGSNATSVISALIGYVAFLVATIFFTRHDMPSNAYSGILGISISNSTVSTMSESQYYPLQTGIVGIVIVALITLYAFNRAKEKTEYSLFPFLTKDATCMVMTILLSLVAGIGIGFVWPYFIHFIERVIHFVEVDTTNPINLGIYGIFERILSVCNLGSLIRQPFWYSTSGGSWVTMAGNSVAGDVNIWAEQLAANSLTGVTGRFITPYYVLNIFAIPAMIWGMFSLYTDKMERQKKVGFFIFATIASVLTGTILPLEILLFLLAPLLFLIHVGVTGILFSLLHAFHIYVGYLAPSTLLTTAMPGTLLELIGYFRYPSLQKMVFLVVIAGLITAVIYYFITRLYFKKMAVDLFKTGAEKELVKSLVKAVGGIENIRMTQSSVANIVVSVYDPSKLDANRLKSLGSYRIYETRAGFRIALGAASTMVKQDIDNAIREVVREENAE